MMCCRVLGEKIIKKVTPREKMCNSICPEVTLCG